MNEITKGPSAVAFSEGESTKCESAFDFTKENDKLKIKGGLVGSKVVAASEVEMLAKLPSKNQLIAMLMSTMNAPAQNLAACCNDVAGRLVRVMDQIAKQKAGA